MMERLAIAGRGTSAELIKEARDPKSGIHDCFEWDNNVAGEKFRLWQACNYWGAIRIELRQPDGNAVKVPAFIPIVVAGEQAYRPVTEVAENPDWRAQMIVQAKRELESWQRRYEMLTAVARMRGVFEAIRVVIEEKD